MKKVYISLVNYSNSVFDKIKESRPLYQILFITSFTLSILYLEFLKHINSLSVFKSKNLEKIVSKYKMFKNFNDINIKKLNTYTDYFSLMQDSFNLSEDLSSSLEGKFTVSTTKEGIINYYKNIVLNNVCIFYTNNSEVCTELKNNIIVNVLDINQNFSSDGAYFFLPSSTYEIFFYIKATKNIETFNFIKNTDLYTKKFNELEKYFIFYKIKGRVEV